jgi:hypothetical protein
MDLKLFKMSIKSYAWPRSIFIMVDSVIQLSGVHCMWQLIIFHMNPRQKVQSNPTYSTSLPYIFLL